MGWHYGWTHIRVKIQCSRYGTLVQLDQNWMWLDRRDARLDFIG
jgi:hypothetical protein